MARAKFNPVSSGVIGKVGGQNLSYTNNGFIIRPTIYTKSPYSPKRSIQRIFTRQLSHTWSTLTAGQKNGWGTAATDYEYINSIGNTITRNNFETFSFCNQNRNTVGLGTLTTAPAFYPITPPTVARLPGSQTQFIIKASVADINLEYSVFVTVNWSQGFQAYNQRPLLTKVLTYAEILAGYDIMPDVKNTFVTPDFITSISVKIFAIHPPSGNKDINGVYLNGITKYTGLGLDLLSYYPFNGNANDHFGINNPTYTGTAFTNDGIILKSAYFNNTAASYINLGSGASLDFVSGGIVQPFSFSFWWKPLDNSFNFLVGKRLQSAGGAGGSYQIVTQPNFWESASFDLPWPKFKYWRKNNFLVIGTQYFVTYTYNSDGSVTSYVNNNIFDVTGGTGVYLLMKPLNVDLLLGRYAPNVAYITNGYMSELTFYNSPVSQADFEIIRLANLAGQTILDIN